MPHFDDFFVRTTDLFSNELRAAIEKAEPPGLAAGPVDGELASLLRTPKRACLAGGGPLADLVRSGLWLLAGDLDRSHTISQDESSREGSFWHGIMHRREADYSNAAYWFRRAGSHPVFEELARTYGDEYVDPYAFNDAVQEACRGGDAAASDRLRQIQWTEWQLLIQRCMTA